MVKRRTLKSRNPIAKAVRTIRPQVVKDKRRKVAAEIHDDEIQQTDRPGGKRAR